MSAAESSSASAQRLAPSGDSESSVPAATTPTKPVADDSEETRVPEDPSPNPDPSSQIALAIVQLLNAEHAGATSGSAVPAAPSPVQTTGPTAPQSWTINGPPIVLELPPAHPQPQPQTQDSWLKSLLSALGVGPNATPARKSKMSLVWNLCWGFSQVVIVSTLTALSNTIWKNPLDDARAQTEWEACDRPLGVWAIIWIVRVVLASGLAYWDYVRIKRARELQPNAVPQPTTQSIGPTPRPPIPPANNGVNNADLEGGPTATDPPPPLVLPYSHLYSRLTLLSSLLTLSWFLIAHILEYTSLNTCRRTSPHLWWLIFGILGIMYIMVLEVLLLGFIILVLAPILFVFWNLFLFCIGRHPAQNPGIIKPDIGKLSKALVERIPLVMYIPPPPTKSKGEAENSNSSPAPDGQQHEYPPVPLPVLTSPTTAASPPPKKPGTRFRFFKRKPSKEEKDSNPAGGPALPSASEVQETWEGGFEKSEYPFVVLEGNRAACAICLMDFEEPKRKEGNQSSPVAALTLPSSSATGEASTSSSPTRSDVVEAERELKLTDAGEGAQPLRLLACGHVFHQTCLDPWLTDVSGRCPVCQRAVDPKELKKRKKVHR